MLDSSSNKKGNYVSRIFITMLYILILVVYLGSPSAFYAMYFDYKYGTILGYLLMIIVLSILAYSCSMLDNKFLFFMGNILSFCMSFILNLNMDINTDWGYFFAPLQTYQLLILITILNLIPQLIIVKIISEENKKDAKNSDKNSDKNN